MTITEYEMVVKECTGDLPEKTLAIRRKPHLPERFTPSNRFKPCLNPNKAHYFVPPSLNASIEAETIVHPATVALQVTDMKTASEAKHLEEEMNPLKTKMDLKRKPARPKIRRKTEELDGNEEAQRRREVQISKELREQLISARKKPKCRFRKLKCRDSLKCAPPG